MLDTILLRFRSLGDEDTINEHISKIEEKGSTWWGWWKKDSEPDRSADIEGLIRKLNGAPLQIGLFNRSISQYCLANVSSIFRTDGKEILSPDPDLTPAYYRNATVPAWLNLTEIKPIAEDDFLEIFGGVPKGEHTLFPFDYSKAGEFDSGIHSPAITALPCDKIIQLSDIHFGSDFGFPDEAGPGTKPLFDHLKGDLSENFGSEVGLFVISGDLTSRADQQALMTTGIDFLNRLSDEFSVPKERFIIVPGNHDIALNDFSETDYRHERMFQLFLKEFYGREKDITGIDRFQTTYGEELQIMRINSVKLRRKEEANFGYVDWSLYRGLLNSIEYGNKTLRIAVMHHHLIPMQKEDRIDRTDPFSHVSTTVDAGTVIEGLQRANFKFALHGHQHIPGVAKICRGQISDDAKIGDCDSGILAISAGSAGVKSGRLSNDFRDNSYNVIDLNGGDVRVHARRYNDGNDAHSYFQFN